MSQKSTVTLSTSLIEKIRVKIQASNGEFQTVEEFIEFILTEVLKEDDASGTSYTSQDEAEIRKRLQALGYLE